MESFANEGEAIRRESRIRSRMSKEKVTGVNGRANRVKLRT